MKKKYITTIEEILALRDTDKKIYLENNRGYYKFVEGIPCFFCHDSTVFYNCTIDFDQVESNLYVFVEEPVKEADESDLGKLCLFWDDNQKAKVVDVLKDISKGSRRFERKTAGWYYHCRRLTPTEVAEISGYKVEEYR